jgi:hypothetical protein
LTHKSNVQKGKGKLNFISLMAFIVWNKLFPNRMAICYPGKLDPKYDPNLNTLFGMPNINLEELSLCQPANKPDSWQIWGEKELHSIVIKSDADKGVQISSSFGKAYVPKLSIWWEKFPNLQTAPYRVGFRKREIGNTMH